MAAKAKKDRTELKNNQISQQNSQNQLYSGFTGRQNDMSKTAYNENSAKTGDLWNAYGGLASGSRPAATNADSSLGSGVASSGGSNGGGVGGGTPTGGDYFSNAEGYATNLAGQYGGVNPEFYKNMMNNGGLDETAINNFRGNGVFNEFQKTGGWSDSDKANFRSRSSSMLPAMYKNMADSMDRRRNVQGGYAPGFDSSTRAMARSQGQAMADANTNAELGLANQIRSGRQWGAEGGANAENALQSLRTGNMMGAESLAQQGRTTGAGLLTQIGSGRTQRDTTMAGVGASNRATDSANERFQKQLDWDRERTGLAGQSDLMNLLYGQQNNYDQNFLRGASQQDQMNSGMFDSRLSGINSTPGWQDVAAPFVGAAAGLAGGFMSGGASSALNSAGGFNIGRNTGINGGRNPWANIQF